MASGPARVNSRAWRGRGAVAYSLSRKRCRAQACLRAPV